MKERCVVATPTNLQNSLEIDHIKTQMGRHQAQLDKYDQIMEELKTNSATSSIVINELKEAIKEQAKSTATIAIAIAKIEERNRSNDKFNTLIIGILSVIVTVMVAIIGWLIFYR
jgi:hypothetical protein